MEESPRELRLSSTLRGLLIGALLLAYGWFMNQPQASLGWAFLVGAGLQVAVILLRRFVPAGMLPQAQYLFELFADAATVFAFALGVLGGILRTVDSF